jgi:hypothetical protein
MTLFIDIFYVLNPEAVKKNRKITVKFANESTKKQPHINGG